MDIGAWLRGLGLGQYEQAFRDNHVDAALLARLTAEDLKEIGVASLGHRRRLLDAIATGRDGPDAPPGSNPPAPLPVVKPRAAGPARDGAERRQLTVMFADLVGSTALSSRLDPEEMREVIRSYQGAVAGEVARFEGHVAKFMGDGVLAYFGWPQAHEDDAERAVRAGLAVTEAVARLGTPDGAPLAARVGIATGPVVVGDLVGEGAAQEQAVVGDTPNLAARLQALAEPGRVLVAAGTRGLLGAGFEWRDLGARTLAGFGKPIRVWHVVRPVAVASRFDAAHGGGLTPLVGREEELAILARRWDLARRGEGQVVRLSGEPGIGKSRLVRALHERIGESPHRWLVHQCSPFHIHAAFHPITAQVERAARLAVEDPPSESWRSCRRSWRKQGKCRPTTSRCSRRC